MLAADDRNALRPFYLVLVVWGEQYRNYFLEYCLPSLLAPSNIPALAGRRPAKYLIATTAEDWGAMRDTAIFRELERHVTATFLELPVCPPDRPYWLQNIVGHKMCCDLIFRDKAYRIFTSPDSVASDGTIARLHELAANGVEVVFKLTVPTAETKTLFRTFAEMGLLPAESARDTGIPLVFSGRQLSAALLRSMHQMSAVNEWEAPHFCGYWSTPWWSVPNEEGIVAFGSFWDVLLIDYAAVKQHESSILDERGWDGDYIMKTVGDLHTAYLVRDTDEINFAGWNSLPWTPLPRIPHGELGKGAALRSSFARPSLNSLHRRLAFFPTRIHAGPLSTKWDAIERKALRTLLTWLDAPAGLETMRSELPPQLKDPIDVDVQMAACRPPSWHPKRFSARIYLSYPACRARLRGWEESLAHALRLFPRTFRISPLPPFIRTAFHSCRIVARRIGMLLVADAVAIRWWKWRLKKALANLSGRPFLEPRPKAPE
jgi:hypothetical protein